MTKILNKQQHNFSAIIFFVFTLLISGFMFSSCGNGNPPDDPRIAEIKKLEADSVQQAKELRVLIVDIKNSDMANGFNLQFSGWTGPRENILDTAKILVELTEYFMTLNPTPEQATLITAIHDKSVQLINTCTTLKQKRDSLGNYTAALNKESQGKFYKHSNQTKNIGNKYIARVNDNKKLYTTHHSIHFWHKFSAA